MRVAIVSANIGGIDPVYPPEKQTGEYELFYYTENNLPFPLPNIDNRMKGKYLKTQLHKYLDHDVFIWIDGSIEITNGDFVSTILNSIKWSDFVSSLHEQRKTAPEELNYIIDCMRGGNRYLLKRYAKQPFRAELDFYKREGLPKDYPLYNCFFFAVKNTPKCNKILDKWWDITTQYSNFDQAAFSYATWEGSAIVNAVDTKDLFTRHKHPGYNL